MEMRDIYRFLAKKLRFSMFKMDLSMEMRDIFLAKKLRFSMFKKTTFKKR